MYGFGSMDERCGSCSAMPYVRSFSHHLLMRSTIMSVMMLGKGNTSRARVTFCCRIQLGQVDPPEESVVACMLRRCILDEAHMIRNTSTQAAKAAHELTASRRSACSKTELDLITGYQSRCIVPDVGGFGTHLKAVHMPLEALHENDHAHLKR